MIIPDWQIRLLVDPPADRSGASKAVYVPDFRLEAFGEIADDQIQPASLDVRLGTHFISHPGGHQFQIPKGEGFYLESGECVLGCLVERFRMPDNLVARVEGKSSWARKFLTVHSAGFIDPGFCGDITMELKNDGYLPIRLAPGDKIAQISFHVLAAPAKRPYGSNSIGSHYQRQTGATPSAL